MNAIDMKNLSVIEFIAFSCTPSFLSAVCCKSIELSKRTSSCPGAVVFIDNPKGHKSLVNRHRNIANVHWWRGIDSNRMINDHPRLLRLRVTHLEILRILFTWQAVWDYQSCDKAMTSARHIDIYFLLNQACGKAVCISLADHANLASWHFIQFTKLPNDIIVQQLLIYPRLLNPSIKKAQNGKCFHLSRFSPYKVSLNNSFNSSNATNLVNQYILLFIIMESALPFRKQTPFTLIIICLREVGRSLAQKHCNIRKNVSYFILSLLKVAKVK